MRNFETLRNQIHAFPFLHQGGDKSASQTCTSDGEPLGDAVQENEGSRLTCSTD